jgi:hypothetical protein
MVRTLGSTRPWCPTSTRHVSFLCVLSTLVVLSIWVNNEFRQLLPPSSLLLLHTQELQITDSYLHTNGLGAYAWQADPTWMSHHQGT